MHDVQLAQNGRRVRCEDHLLQVVDDDFVAAVGTQRRLDGFGDGLAGLDVADDGSIFGVVAVVFMIRNVLLLLFWCFLASLLSRGDVWHSLTSDIQA